MSRTTITLEIDADCAQLVRQYADFVQEMKDLAAASPFGSVLAVCEEAVVERGREQLRDTLEHAVTARIESAEKKGRL
jgi:hypothetical protein